MTSLHPYKSAEEFIRANSNAPFMLCLNYRAPHKEWLPVADVDWEPYETMEVEIPEPDYPDLDVPKVVKMMGEYLASVAGVDRNVGRTLAVLDELGLAENTVVIFTSDNGYNMGHNGIWHKGNGIWATYTTPEDTENINGKYRPNLYDLSLRVPGIVRWPKVIRPGTVIDETVSNLDWYPTLVAMADESLPRTQTVRGRNLLPLLRGEKPASWDNDFFAEYSMQIYCRTHMRAYRTAEWKLVRDLLNPERDELYDLARDPGEHTNLIHSTEARALEAIEALDRNIREKMQEINDPVLRLAAD